MNPENPNPMFTFAPKPFVKEQKGAAEATGGDVPFFQPLPRKEPAMQPIAQPTVTSSEVNGNYSYGTETTAARTNEVILAKLNELETLILEQRQQLTTNYGHEEIINQLRAHTLQIAKLSKEIKLIEHQSGGAELKSEIDVLTAQLRSTNLYLSKIDRKIDYLMNIIGALQNGENSNEGQQELLQSSRTQALMLSKLERKINELLYQQNR